MNPAVHQVLDIAVQLVVTTVGAMLLATLKRGLTWLGAKIESQRLIEEGQRLENDAQVRSYLNDALALAIDFALSRHLGATITTQALEDNRHSIISTAAEYAGKRVGGALAHFDIGPDAVREMVEARLPKVL